MIKIIRGIPIGLQTQVGFYGDLRQVYQQYYEMVEGRQLAQRHFLNQQQIQQNQMEEYRMNDKRKRKSCCLECKKQISLAIYDCDQCILLK